jgi:HSP20 family protein
MFFAPAMRNGSVVPGRGVVDGAFERFVNEAFRGLQGPWQGMEEDEKSWTVTLDMPGVTREHLSVSIEGRLVRIETAPEARRQFKGVYEMPQEIDPDGCEAKLENGVLTLKLGKVEQASTGRQIAVN